MEIKSNNIFSEEELLKQELVKRAAAERKRKEEEKRKKLLPPPKFYYDVKIECMLPATLTYRVHAETPEKAAEMIKGASPTSVKHRLIGRKEIKLMVFDAGCNMMKLVKNLFR